MPREASLYFDAVFMIESLTPGSNKTGTALFDHVIAPFTAKLDRFRPTLRPAHGRREFFAALEELRGKFLEEGHSPILHVETHGEEQSRGLVLGSEELVEWDELRSYLQAINRRTQFNLLVVMAACKGAHLIRSMRPTERAPFWGVIGPKTDVYDLSMQRALEGFYTELLSTQDGTEAVAALNGATQASGKLYTLLDAETFFCWVYEKYEELTTDAEVEARINRVVAEWAREFGPDVRATTVIRADARERVRDHTRWYDYLRQHFLMLDLFPENAPRFSLTYEDCMRTK